VQLSQFLFIGTPSTNTYLSTKERKALANGPDADQDLFALYMQFGRYLAIASYVVALPMVIVT
jgi:hypothetical protein